MSDESVTRLMEFDPTVLSPEQFAWCANRDPLGDLQEIALVGILSGGIAVLILTYDNERPVQFALASDGTLTGVDRL